VVANAVQALGEIQETAAELNAFDINIDKKIHNKLLVALNECTEYQQKAPFVPSADVSDGAG
jgi:hypothetical protein